MNGEKKKIVSILRSLLISRPQNGMSIRELKRDFHEFEGLKIPLFEFRTVEDFLRSSGEFIIENVRGELIIFEKPTAESSHMSKLVTEQNRPRRKIPSVRQRQPRKEKQTIYSRSWKSRNCPPTFDKVSNTQRSFRSVPVVHQRNKATTIEFSFDQLTENKNGPNQSVDDVIKLCFIPDDTNPSCIAQPSHSKQQESDDKGIPDLANFCLNQVSFSF